MSVKIIFAFYAALLFAVPAIAAENEKTAEIIARCAASAEASADMYREVYPELKGADETFQKWADEKKAAAMFYKGGSTAEAKAYVDRIVEKYKPQFRAVLPTQEGQKTAEILSKQDAECESVKPLIKDALASIRSNADGENIQADTDEINQNTDWKNELVLWRECASAYAFIADDPSNRDKSESYMAESRLWGFALGMKKTVAFGIPDLDHTMGGWLTEDKMKYAEMVKNDNASFKAKLEQCDSEKQKRDAFMEEINREMKKGQ